MHKGGKFQSSMRWLSVIVLAGLNASTYLLLVPDH